MGLISRRIEALKYASLEIIIEGYIKRENTKKGKGELYDEIVSPEGQNWECGT